MYTVTFPTTTLSPTGEYSYFSRSRKDRHKEPVCLIPNDSVQALGGQIELLCGEAGCASANDVMDRGKLKVLLWYRVWFALDIKVCHGRGSERGRGVGHKFARTDRFFSPPPNTNTYPLLLDPTGALQPLPLTHAASLLIGWQKQSIMHWPTQSNIKQVKGNWWHPRP